MLLEVTKMNGAGNDFVLIDNRSGSVSLTREQVVRLCDRHRGIGSDGLMLLVPNTTGQADWSWRFYNSDGSDAEMCGNGARCFARYIQRTVGCGDRLTFETVAGVISATFDGERPTVGLTAPTGLRLNESIPVNGETLSVCSLNTGVPHAVIFVDDADRAMVRETGAALRHHEHFQPRGTNVNFAQLLSPGKIRVRTYERGVEGETLACGTGVTASALIAARINGWTSPVAVQVRGGDLLAVHFESDGGPFRNVRLEGPADFTFDARIEL